MTYYKRPQLVLLEVLSLSDEDYRDLQEILRTKRLQSIIRIPNGSQDSFKGLFTPKAASLLEKWLEGKAAELKNPPEL